MELESITIKNYRSFDSSGNTLTLHSGLNVIVGENNSGKSNILKAIELIKNNLSKDYQSTVEERFEEKLENHVDLTLSAVYHNDDLQKLADGIGIITTNFSDFKNNFGSALEIKFTDTVNANKFLIRSGKFRYIHNIGCILENHDLLGGHVPTTVDKINNVAKNDKISFYQALEKIINEHESNTKSSHMCLQVPQFDDALQRIFDEKIIIFPEIRQRPKSTNDTSLIATTGESLPSFLFNLEKSDKREKRETFKKIKKAFKQIFPDLELVIIKGPKITIEKPNKYDASQDSFGFGFVEMINFLTHLICFGEKGGYIFIIEEPENHLHPHSRRILSNLIMQYSNNNQIILITHSPDFIDMKNLESITRVVLEESTRIFQLPSDIFDGDELESLRKIRTNEQKDFFFARSVLLVEGDTEMGTIPTISKNVADWDFDVFGISLINVGGHHFSTFMKLLDAFEIPFLVMCDRDVALDIVTHIDHNRTINTSSLMFQLNKVYGLKETEKVEIENIESNTTTRKNKKGNDIKCYTDECFQIIKSIVESYNVLPLDDDFEGIFKKMGYEKEFDESRKLFGKSKVMAGIYLADHIAIPPYGQSKIPAQLSNVIEKMIKTTKREK